MSRDRVATGVLRALMRAAPIIGAGVTAIVIAVLWSGAFPISDLKLTARETLALVPQAELRVIGTDRRFNWFRCANPKANEQLMSKYRSADFIDKQITIVSILGYTGGKAEARFVIASLRERSEQLISGKKKEERGDKYLLWAMLNALGNMGRRDIKSAKQFVENVAKGKDTIRIPIASPDLTPMWVIDAYAFLEPKDLDATIQAALKRIPEPNHQNAVRHDYRATYRSVRKREAMWIWGFDLRAFRRKVK